MMIPKVVINMIGRMTKTANSSVKMLVKSLGQTSVQFVLGMVIAVYVAFLETDKESLLSVFMSNPMGRLFVLGFLAVLAVAAPPVAVLFAVLVVMSYTKTGMGIHKEGFWTDNTKEDDESSKDSVKIDEDKKEEDKTPEKHTDLMKQLSAAMKTITTTDKKEGFGPMYEGSYNADDDELTTEEDAKAFMQSMNNLGGISGYSADESSHSSV